MVSSPTIPVGRSSSTVGRHRTRLIAIDPARRGSTDLLSEVYQTGGATAWRDGIYDYVHYHSRIHEVLGVARGKGRVGFGGNKGRIFTLNAGDVTILPAGTGHQCLVWASDDFFVIGAYPPAGTHTTSARRWKTTRESALKTIPKVALPRKDPAYGDRRPALSKLWKKAR